MAPKAQQKPSAAERPASRPDEPEPGGWDDNDTLVGNSEHKHETPREMPAAQRVTPVNPVAPPSPKVEPVPAAMGSASRALDAAVPGLSSAMREQVWAIVRAAVDESLAPVQAKLREVETKLEKAEKAAVPAAKPAAASVVTAPIPSPAIDAPTPIAPAVKVSAAPAAIPVSLAPAAAVSVAPAAAAPTAADAPAVRPTFTSTSYGLVSVPPGPPPKSIVDEAEALGAIEIPDFGRKKRMLGRVIMTIMILAVISAIVATILSHQNV